MRLKAENTAVTYVGDGWPGFKCCTNVTPSLTVAGGPDDGGVPPGVPHLLVAGAGPAAGTPGGPGGHHTVERARHVTGLLRGHFPQLCHAFFGRTWALGGLS